MTLDISKYQVINDLDNERLIGYSNNIIKLYKDYIKELVEDINCQQVCEDYKFEIIKILHFLENLYIASEEWRAPYLIVVGCDDLGRYYYRTLVETEYVGGE